MPEVTKLKTLKTITAAPAADDRKPGGVSKLAILKAPKTLSSSLGRRSTVTLPDGPEEPLSDIGEATFLFYGEPKIGKTSLAAQFPDALFLMFEPGGKGLRISRRQAETWSEFAAYVDALEAAPQRFKTIVIDPVDVCYKLCVDHICKIEGVDDPGEVTWGNGWKAIDKEFALQINRISNLGRGIIFISHVELREFQRRNGPTYHKMVPTMMKQARACIKAFVDIIGYYGFYGSERYLTIEGSDEVEGGNRLAERFRTANGDKLHSIPMGEDENEAYANVIAAFNNEQESRCEPDSYANISDTPVAPKKRKA